MNPVDEIEKNNTYPHPPPNTGNIATTGQYNQTVGFLPTSGTIQMGANAPSPLYPNPQGNYLTTQFQPIQPGLLQVNPTTPLMTQGNDMVAAAQAVNTAICQNGRTPISVVCPNCKNFVTTETNEVEVQNIQQSQSKIMYVFFGGGAVLFIGVFTAVIFISGSFIPLFIMPVFLLFLLGGFFLMRTAGKAASKICTDVQHHCSNCKVLLGTNSGMQFYQQMNAYNRYGHGRRY